MSTYVTSRGTLLEAIHAATALFAERHPFRANTLLLGEGCRADLARELDADNLTHRAPFGGARECLYGLQIKLVPGGEVSVGNFVSLQ